MEHLHIRLPAELKHAFRQRCRDRNISVTSALIIMMTAEVEWPGFVTPIARDELTMPLGFVLQQ